MAFVVRATTVMRYTGTDPVPLSVSCWVGLGACGAWAHASPPMVRTAVKNVFMDVSFGCVWFPTIGARATPTCGNLEDTDMTSMFPSNDPEIGVPWITVGGQLTAHGHFTLHHAGRFN